MIWDGREVGSQQSIAVIMRGRWKHARMPKFHFKCNSMHWLAIFIRASQSPPLHRLLPFPALLFVLCVLLSVYKASVLLNIFVYANE